MTARLHTLLCEQLGIDVPIIQAPIGSASCPALAAAVSNAGGLGMLAMTWREPDDVRRVIRETRALTDRPFGVNLVLQWPQEERVQICLEEGVPVVSFFWGDPSAHVAAVHGAGAQVIFTVGSAVEARQAVAAGVDVVVAQGWEAGGHVWGQVATLPLIPCVVDAVAPVPVVAAGGIADGRGLAAALLLGAAGVWMGTRFLASEEAVAHPIYREQVLHSAETGTVYAAIFGDNWPDAPHRTLRTSTLTAWEAVGRPSRGGRPGEGDVVAYNPDGSAVARYSDVLPAPGMTGAVEELALHAGQSAGLIRSIAPAATIVRTLVEEAVAALARGAALLR
jgi:nitronate monooxygenase